MAKNYLIFEDPAEVPEYLNKILEQTISYEVKMKGNDYDMYRLNPPENLLINRGKIEKKLSDCEQNMDPIPTFKYLQSIYRSYVRYLITKIKDILNEVDNNENENVKNLLKLLDNIYTHNNFYDELYNYIINLIKDKSIFNKLLTTNVNFLNNFKYFSKNILNIDDDGDEFNLFALINELFTSILIIQIKSFRINITDSMLKLFKISLYLPSMDEDYSKNANLDKTFNNKFNEQYKIDALRLNNVINMEKLLRPIIYNKTPPNENSIPNMNNLSYWIHQSGFRTTLSQYIAIPLILIYNKEKITNIQELLKRPFQFTCSDALLTEKECLCYLDNINNEFIYKRYYQLCPIQLEMLSSISSNYNTIKNLIESHKNFFYFQCKFTEELDYIDFTFENDVVISDNDKKILGEKFPDILKQNSNNISLPAGKTINPFAIDPGSFKNKKAPIAIPKRVEKKSNIVFPRGVRTIENSNNFRKERMNSVLAFKKQLIENRKRTTKKPSLTNKIKAAFKAAPKSAPKSANKTTPKTTSKSAPKTAPKSAPNVAPKSASKAASKAVHEETSTLNAESNTNVGRHLENRLGQIGTKQTDLDTYISKMEKKQKLNKNEMEQARQYLQQANDLLNTMKDDVFVRSAKQRFNNGGKNNITITKLKNIKSIFRRHNIKSGGNKRAKRVNRTQWKVKASYTSPQ
jgi:hypothetical protein